MSYSTKDIRNICLLGHGGNGKTSLAESMAFLTGGTDRLGKVTDGNTVSDYDSEEIKRKISISIGTLFVNYKNCKINILDTPGYFDFAGEVAEALRVADAGIIVVEAKSGVNVGAEKSWKKLTDKKLPKLIYISKIDEENADYDAAIAALKEKFGHTVCPLMFPVKEGGKIVIVDVISRKAYAMNGNKSAEVPVPASAEAELARLTDALNENIAETSEELMEKFFGGEEFTSEEIHAALKQGFAEESLVPVFCGCAMTGAGTFELLEAIVNIFPSPLDNPAGEIKPEEPVSAIIYKTLSDQYGKFSYFKVLSGTLAADMVLTNPRTGTTEKLGHIYTMMGKKSIEVKEIICGDIGAASKLGNAATGDTLCDSKNPVAAAGIEFDEPCYSMAIAPKTKGQEDKIAAGLTRLSEEDRTFSMVNNSETKQLVVSGAGDIQLDVLCSKLKDKFGVEVVLSPARVAYREKIRKSVKVQGRHKKQTGGHGQFGDVWIEFEPQDETDDLIFADNVFGGSVPKNFFPAVEKGLRECIQKGVLAGYPVVGLKATLYDGSYHPVDSSEMAFKMAATLAYKAGLPQANPVILEPIGSLAVTIPDSYMGDIIGDLNKRRGRVMGMTPTGSGLQVVEAEVPMAEMSTYAIDLRSMTQGRGYFSFKFERYEEVPAMVQAKIIEESKTDEAE